MPELPEVETIVRYLKPKIRGRRILKAESDTPRLFRGNKNGTKVLRTLKGKTVQDLERHGKNIFFKLSGGRCLLLHLMMTGRLFWNPKETRPHDRLIFYLSGNNKLVFNDIRKFGSARLIEEIPASCGKPNFLLGPDVLSINSGKFKNIIQNRGGKIKNVLLNQKILAGIGNIYADEILWYAGISPQRAAFSLKNGEIKKLFSATRKVLKLAIKKGGTTSRDYLRPDGKTGGYYEIRRAYQRAGQKCRQDGTFIKRILIGGRAAYFCPRHQK